MEAMTKRRAPRPDPPASRSKTPRPPRSKEWVPKHGEKVQHCPNCGAPHQPGHGHFVSPCLGDSGFFTCEKVESDAS